MSLSRSGVRRMWGIGKPRIVHWSETKQARENGGEGEESDQDERKHLNPAWCCGFRFIIALSGTRASLLSAKGLEAASCTKTIPTKARRKDWRQVYSKLVQLRMVPLGDVDSLG